MRDVVLTLIIAGMMLMAIQRPFWGVLLWVWLSLMNPHRLTWGFAYYLPFASMAVVVLTLGLIYRASTLYRFPISPVTLGSILLIFWLCISPFFAIEANEGAREFELWSRAVKIQVLVLVTFLVVGTRDELHKLVWVLALSIGFYGIKGGLFVLATGGEHKVFGPMETFLGDNNHMALALVMCIPLLRYLQLQATKVWHRRAYLVALLLCTVSALGSYSRGALVALAAMGIFLWFKGKNRLRTLIFALITVPILLAFMPDEWWERMNTIGDYQEDRSAQGRINAWWMAWNLALSRFPIGGGFTVWNDEAFARYSPIPEYVHAAHSIYFQILGEHGFMGLFLFLFIFASAFFTGSSVLKKTRGVPEMAWAADLARMCQVSLLAFAVGGAFLSLSYFDFPYYIAAVLVILRRLVVEGEQARMPGPMPLHRGLAPPAGGA
jgi:probable O-glycosylation ligase (exosortase A-associated)